VDTSGSKYIERRDYLSRYSHERTISLRESTALLPEGPADEKAWLQEVKNTHSRFIPFLEEKCDIQFQGRILEVGAGGCWLSAELSRLPRVVEVISTDLSPRLLKEYAPKVFKALKANAAKITRTPADYHKLGFPANYFDFVVCSAALHDSTNIVQVLREVKRVLKPGGRLVAIREPVWPLVKLKSRARILERLMTTGRCERYYTLAEYKEFFRQAALPLEVKNVSLSSGWRYYMDKMVNGLTHARYAFIGIKRSRP
jgi:ubiquinone/menaquinone biosynthesis C-methylase UbiE